MGPVVSEIFLVFPIVSLREIDAPGAWSVWISGAGLAQFTMGTNKHCYNQNIEALGLVVSEKIFFLVFFFPIVSLWAIDAPGA